MRVSGSIAAGRKSRVMPESPACGSDGCPRRDAVPGAAEQALSHAKTSILSAGRREPVLASGKHIVVVGGGDTASDCIGTAFRQGAVKVTQLDIRPQPPIREDKMAVWPFWATKMRTSSSQAEGAVREFQVGTLEFVGENGVLTGVKCCQVDEKRNPVEGTEFIIKADLAFIAIGFRGPFENGVLQDLGDRLDVGIGRARLDLCEGERGRLQDVWSTMCGPPETYGAGNRWSSGRSERAARLHTTSTKHLMGSTILPL